MNTSDNKKYKAYSVTDKKLIITSDINKLLKSKKNYIILRPTGIVDEDNNEIYEGDFVEFSLLKLLGDYTAYEVLHSDNKFYLKAVGRKIIELDKSLNYMLNIVNSRYSN